MSEKVTVVPTLMSREVSHVAQTRRVVLAILLINVACAIALPVLLVDPSGARAYVVVGALIAAHAGFHALVLRAAVSPWIEARDRHALTVGLVATTLVAWPAMYGWAAPGEEPWAWLAGFTIAALPMVAGRMMAAVAATSLIGAAVIGAVLWNGSIRDNLVFTLLAAAAAAMLAFAVVWMLRLLVAAESGRAAESELAVAEERLRFSRDLHDVLGHHLNVMALKAELAADLAHNDPDQSRAEAIEVRVLASQTLREVRQAVHGYGTVDLDEQIRGAELVLRSAGVTPSIRTIPVSANASGSQFLAMAIREGVTNVLTHSDARDCTIELVEDSGMIVLTIINDRPHKSRENPGMGLTGLADRGSHVGATVAAGPDGENFRLRVELTVPR